MNFIGPVGHGKIQCIRQFRIKNLFWPFKEFASGRFPYQRCADTVPILPTTMSDRSRVSHVRNETLDGPFGSFALPLALYQLADRIKVNCRFKGRIIFFGSPFTPPFAKV